MVPIQANLTSGTSHSCHCPVTRLWGTGLVRGH
jgi:hypothetical protein